MQPTQTAQPTTRSSQKRTMLVLCLIAGGLLLAGLVAVVLFVFNRSGFNSPEAVGEAYVTAYETKDFSTIMREGNVCKAYRTEFGVDTAKFESSLQGLDITGQVTKVTKIDNTTHEVDITLTTQKGSGESKESTIFIKVTQEEGNFTFCGEGARQ